MCKNNNWPKHRPMNAEHLARGIYYDMCIEYNCECHTKHVLRGKSGPLA